MRKRLFIIDGHALCYRAYYAFIKNPIINSNGQNISAIFGFARIILKLIKEEKPDYFVVAFDPPKKSFRFNIYPEYKANRKKMPDELKTQIEEIKNMLLILNIPMVMEEGFEADDILGTFARKYASNNLEVIIVSGDKDAFQLVNDNVKIYANKNGVSSYTIYDEKAIINKIGIKPEQVIDYMALMGDSSDNIPGVRGIGEKTAKKLICQFHTLEKIYTNIDEIQNKKIKDTLLSDREIAILSKELVTIKTDIELNIDIDSLIFPVLKPEDVRKYFHDLEMKSIINDFFPHTEDEETRKVENKNYKIIRTKKELEDIIKLIKKKGVLSIDTETTSIYPVDAELVGISLSINEREGWFIPINNKNLYDDEYLDKEIYLNLLRPILEDPTIKKIGQNIKYDTIILQNINLNMQGIYFDTMVASYLLNPSESRHNLDDMAYKYLDYKTIAYKELVGTGKNAIPIMDVPLIDLSEYAIEDADITYRLYKLFMKKLMNEELNDLFFDLEMPLVSVLAIMERNGVKIDIDYFKKLSRENEKLLKDVVNKIYSLAGINFNINSTKELSIILFEKLGLPPVKKIKTGYSTNNQVLEALKRKHVIIEYLISYRTLSKLKNTYIDALPRLISNKTGRLHTSYNQTVVATGRLSSSNPNLQNIPIKDDFGKKIREGFIPDDNCIIMSADYSQIELRLAAHISKDANMLRAFEEGIDIHNLTASSIFGVEIDSITPDMRRKAKIINFTTIYGGSSYGISQQADIQIVEASKFIIKYFETYPGFKKYIENTIDFARENGYVQTLLGRKRRVLEINSSNRFRREGAERIAINTPIQGTAADLIKVAMINIQRKLIKENYNTKMIIQVHDELVFDVPIEERESIMKLIKSEMEGAMELLVPLVVDIGWGRSWAKAHL